MEESNDVEWQWEEEKKAQVQVTVSFGHKFNMEATYADTLRWTWASSGKCLVLLKEINKDTNVEVDGAASSIN